jgi:hypothetical protein
MPSRPDEVSTPILPSLLRSATDERDANIFEQSSAESEFGVGGEDPLRRRTVWASIGKACKDVLKQANVAKEAVKGVG